MIGRLMVSEHVAAEDVPILRRTSKIEFFSWLILLGFFDDHQQRWRIR
jgi:hypothetical protein